MMGYTGTPIGQLHNELFRAGGPHKFPYRYMDAKTVTDLLHSCGGVVVLAHPGQYKADNVMEMMIEEHMLDGIELNHPRNDEKTSERITSLCMEHDLLIAPADSKLTYYPIHQDTYLTIKDTVYSLSDLLKNQSLAQEYDGGTCLIFRLTVDDYHRYCYIDDGTKEQDIYIPGIFHTVNPIANDYYPIYKMNSREYTVIDSNNFGRMIQMEVGAMMVGKIVNYKHSIATKGEEKGYFEFGGSTVVLILKKDTVKIDDDIINNSSENIETRVLLGQTIGHKGV